MNMSTPVAMAAQPSPRPGFSVGMLILALTAWVGGAAGPLADTSSV